MEPKVPKIVVIGGTFIDVAIKCSQIPSPGEDVNGSVLSYTFTGPGPNQAVQAALCGCHVHLISKIGGDPFGKMVINSLAEYNVNSDFVYTAEAKNTGMIVTLVNAAGENASCTYNGANAAFLPSDIDSCEQVISDADVCLIHGHLPRQTIISAIRCAELHNTKIILNPATPLNETGSQQTEIPTEYFSADILIPNLYEAAELTEHSEANIRTAKSIASEMVARGVRAAVITMGKRGSMVVDRSNTNHIPAFEIELVDHTCTGDAFAGALAAYCAVKDDIKEAVKFASAAGALACTKFGSIDSLPTKAEIIELLQKDEFTE